MMVLAVVTAAAVAGVAFDLVGARCEDVGVVTRGVALRLVVLQHECVHRNSLAIFAG